MKNLLFLHLESVSRQRFERFAAAFPHTRALFRDALVFDGYHSSATSTLMVLTYLWHGNDFEFDAAPAFEGMRPARNNRHLFSLLHERGYRTGFLGLNAFHTHAPTTLASWPEELPPVWGTHDFPTLYAKFDEATDRTPFALFVWNLVTHVEHSQALSAYASGLTDQLRRACAVADEAVGWFLATLERKGLLANTTIVVYGDHGDDYWTHGFRSGLVHGTEPYADVTWAPLAIRDPALQAGTHAGLASTIDLRATCLGLLGVADDAAFRPSGVDLRRGASDVVFAQNFTANQAEDAVRGIAKAFAANDGTYTLLASPDGLELYASQLDPGNHCNLLQFFEPAPDGGLAPRRLVGASTHFHAALANNPRNLAHLDAGFRRLREALAQRVAAKRAFVGASGAAVAHLLDPRCFDRFSRRGSAPDVAGAPVTDSRGAGAVAFDYSFKLR